MALWIFMVLVLVCAAFGLPLLLKFCKKKRALRELKIALEAQEREKERIAKDLHDYFGARLSTLKLYMQTINKYDAQRISTMTDVAMQMIDSTIVELRHLLYDLDPKQLHPGGLINALQDMIQRLESILKLQIETDFSGFAQNIDYRTEISIFRIVQELVNNTLKHAHTTQLAIRLKQEHKELVLSYSDQGLGFDLNTVVFGYGLRNLHQHSRALGASVQMHSAPKAGFDCQIRIPTKNRHYDQVTAR